jgi:hypothetical protein
LELSDPKIVGPLYERLLKPLQFDSYQMKDSTGQYKNYHYQAQLKNSAAPKDKVLRLAQEQGTLSTSLPLSHESSVFLRVDETRMDIMKGSFAGPVPAELNGG